MRWDIRGVGREWPSVIDGLSKFTGVSCKGPVVLQTHGHVQAVVGCDLFSAVQPKTDCGNAQKSSTVAVVPFRVSATFEQNSVHAQRVVPPE